MGYPVATGYLLAVAAAQVVVAAVAPPNKVHPRMLTAVHVPTVLVAAAAAPESHRGT